MTELKLEDWLPRILDLYYKHELPAKQVAVHLGISKTSVKRILKKSGYILRNPTEAMKLAYEKGRAAAPRYERTFEIRQETSKRLEEYYSQHPHPWLGSHHTERTKLQYSLDRRREHLPAQTRQNLSRGIKRRFSNPQNCTMYGKHHSEETKAKLRQKAIERWKCPEFRAKMRVASKDKPQKISNIQKKNWQKPEYRAKVLPACLKSRRPTDLEARLITLIEQYGLPYKYTGDGSFIIGRLNPDFVNVNGDKIAIEVFGGHWHQNKTDPLRTEEGRRAILKEYGWQLIVIWGDELKSLPEDAIVERIKGVANHG